ncbi:MAG: RloB family protein [Candidatus Symbiothrix sp.]|jgi:hypothetical protein|nr:RloB family protein [Candidatus Symbiothrix sp.]
MGRSTEYNILIICEGTNTEPLFFNSIRDRIIDKVFDIEDVVINILPKPKIEGEGDEEEVSGHGKKRRKRELKQGTKPVEEISGTPPEKWIRAAQKELEDGAYEEVWAVFDHDNHPTRKEAFELATKNINGKQVQIAFTSISFEYYLLLHFEKIYKTFDKSECRESHNKEHKHPKSYNCGTNKHSEDCHGDKCINGYMRTKGYITIDDSTKGGTSVFNLIKDKLEIGFINAAWIRYKSNYIDSEIPIYDRNPYVTTDKIVSRLIYGSILEYVYVGFDETYKIENSFEIKVGQDSIWIKNISNTTKIIPKNIFQFIAAERKPIIFGERKVIDNSSDSTFAIPENIKSRNGLILFSWENYRIFFEKEMIS